MRARNIKPAFFKNEALAELPFEYRLLFIGLWCLADRAGRLEYRPKKIKMELFPADDVDCWKGVMALHFSGLVVAYAVDNVPYVWIPTFLDHQRPHHKEAKSDIPEYVEGVSTNLGAFLHQPREVTAPTQEGADTDLGTSQPALNPDVLNPDVLNPDVLNPDPGFPASPSPESQTPIGQALSEPAPMPKKAKPKKPKEAKEGEEPHVPKTQAVWRAYEDAYQSKYGVKPTRNATTNAQMGMFVNRVPLDEAPAIAEWFVWSNKRIYVERGHQVAMLLRDAETLRMEWQRGRTTTSSEAAMADKTQGRGNVFRGLMEDSGDGIEARN